MDPRSLVTHFDPLEDREPGVFTCLEAGAVHQLFLQDRPQTFHHRVVVAISRATHALLHAEIGKHLAAFASRGIRNPRTAHREANDARGLAADFFDALPSSTHRA